MPRYRLTIAYDGTDFCGWQKQEPPSAPALIASIAPPESGDGIPPLALPSDDSANATNAPKGNPPIAAYSADTPQIPSIREGRVALRTVQGVVEQAVREIVREPIELLGASRTDSGVHSRGQVAAFTCEPRDPAAPFKGTGWPLDRGTDRLMAALNSRLPDDVQITAAAVADNDFDPIGGCTSKSYSYTYHVGLERPLWDRRDVTHIRWPRTVDLAAMNSAAQVLVGEHDFAAFAAAGHGRLTTVRTVYSLVVIDQGAGRYRLEISGNGFLWNMVRIVAGTLLQVGIGQRTVDDVRAALESRDRAKAGSTLGPEGLCLEWIKYGSP